MTATMSRIVTRLAGGLALLIIVGTAASGEMLRIPPGKVVWKAAEGLPEGFFLGMLHEDQTTKGRAVLVMFPRGGRLPRHWHTAAERIVVIRGPIHLTDADGTMTVLAQGGYAYTPGKAIHATACVSKHGCLVYSATDGPFDLVRVDTQGKPVTTP